MNKRKNLEIIKCEDRSMKDYSNISFAEYSEIQYKSLRESLRAFPGKEIKAFWDSEQEMVKKAYNDFIANYNKPNSCKVPLADGLAYAMSLMF